MYIVAGALPWHHMPGGIEAEFEGQVDQSVLPDWIAATGGAPQTSPGLYYVGPQDLDDNLRAALANLGAQRLLPTTPCNTRGAPCCAGRRPDRAARSTRDPLAERTGDRTAGPADRNAPQLDMADWVIPAPGMRPFNN